MPEDSDRKRSIDVVLGPYVMTSSQVFSVPTDIIWDGNALLFFVRNV